MTILCSTILEKIVVEEEVTSPDLILEQTSERLTKKIQDNHLDGDEEDFKGGMDVAIVHINMKTKEIKFSGARNPLYVVRHSELIEIKPTRRSVAYKTARKMPDFAVETFQLMDNDHLYMFSDGFADQKGGPKGKKYYYKPFKEFLAKLPANNPIDYQHDILEAEFNRWRGDIEQYDDVIIVGLEIEETV